MKAKKKAKRPIILVGETSSSKTTTVRHFAENLNPETFVHCRMALSSQTSAATIQHFLVSFLEQYTTYTMRPKYGKKMIMFVDDINRPQADCYGTQETTAFLKLLIENSGIFHQENNFNWNTINDVYFYTTLSTTGRSSQQVDPRFLSLFSIFSTWAPKDDVISHIYSSVLQGHTAVFDASIKSICPAIISATIQIYKFAVQMLMPTPKKFHYSFNLRDLSRIIEGLLQISPPYYTNTHQFIRVWRNEVTRVLCDRLSTQEDEILLQNKIKETINEYFVDSIDFVMRDPLLFGDYRNAMQPGLRRDYEDLLDYEAVYHLFTEILDEIRKTTPQVSLLLFEDALEHLTRIHRVLRIYRGHALVVGPAGSGKQTVVNLASYTAGCKVFCIKLRRGYDESMFRNDVRELYKETGLQRQPTTFLLKAHQIIDDSFLEIINTVLITGSFMSVFTHEEKNAFLKECSFAAEHHDTIETNMFSDWETIEMKSKENLHIIILMPHCDEVLRKRCYKYPGLLNNTIIDWMQPWPSEALYAIARRHLKDAEKIPDMYKEAIVEVMVFVYESTSKFSYEINGSKQSFITPRHYLDVIEIYITMVGGNLEENHMKCGYLEKAITKLTEATKHMEKMRIKIEQQKLSVDEKKNVCESLSTDIFEASDILEMKRKEASEKSQEIDEITLELNQQMNEIQAVLTRAMEDIEKAQDSIRYLDLEEISKISAQDVPSEMAAVVFECILILLGSSVINWQETKAMLDDPLFLSNLEEINLNSISIQQQKQIRSRLKRLGKIKDKDETKSADVAFLMLVEAILNYCAAFRETKPKQERISELEKSLNKTQNYMNNLNVVIGETEKQLEVLNEKQVKAVSESENEEADLQVTFQKIEAAEKLIKGLEEDNIKWEEELQTLKKCHTKVVGNRLICAFFLAYSGTFTWEQRTKLSIMWLEKTRTKRIPISKPFNLEEELTSDILLSKWKKDFLPNNEWSLQNAILITFSPRFPFCLDPKEQAVKWIMKCESKNNLIVLTFEDPEFQEQLKMSIKIKKSILIKDVDYLDPVITEILEKPIEGELGYNTENVYEAESGENETIHLYMTTKSPSFKFDPSIFSQTTVINFEISPKELEESLLNIIIENEQNNLWKQCEEVKKADYFSRCEQSNLNRSLLEKVGAPEHCVLESTQRIEELHFIKLEIHKVHSKLEKNELFMREFESQVSIYNTIAKCGTVLYFVIKNLDLVNSLYQCSLNLYTEEFKRSLKKYENHPITKTHVKDFEQHLKRNFCRFGCRGVFSAHKQLVPFLMTIEMEKLKGNLNQREIEFFIAGSKEITDSELPPFKWLTKKGWNDMKKLSQNFPEAFENIVELLTKHGADWEKWYSSQKMDKWNFPSSMSHLMPFQKLMLLRCICIQQLPQALNHYISETMGEEFIDLPYQSINEAFEECTPKIPIIVLYEPGFDPLEKIKKLACKSGIADLSLVVKVLEKHEEETNYFQDQIRSGEWVIYYNWDSNKCLLKKTEDLLKCEYDTHPNFQLWLIAESKTTLPIHILQSSIRVILDTPSPIKFKLRNIYEDMEENFLESCSHPSFKPLVYVTSFFHSVVQERKKFVKVGWNVDYDFGYQDFLVAIAVLKAHLSNAVNSKYDFIPWQCLTFLIGEIIYSGYILDKYDRKIILTYLEEYFDDFLFSGNESFAFHKDFEGKYRVLPDGNKEDYIAEIDRLPLVTTSSVLGLHLNNEKFYNENSMETIWTLVGLVQGSSGGKSECNEEDIVIDIIERMVDVIPSEFNRKKIQNSHREKKFTSPITSVLLHELEGFNSLIKKMNTSVTDLKNAVKGKIKMEEEFHLIFTELLNGKLPVEWRKLSPPTCTSLGTWIEYTVQRAQQYAKWCAQGQLPVIWLGGLQSPKSYLMSLLQAAAKKKGWPLENLLLKTEITQIMDLENIQEPPEVGCYISKVFLQGAGWDMNKQCLKPLEPNGLLTKLPILWVTPNENFSLLLKENLKIPVHQSFLRNQSMDSLVFEAELNSSVHTTCWILEGICMLLNKD